MNFEYRKEHGFYAWYSEGELLFMTSEVAIAYSDPGDQGITCIHKHGDPERVRKWFNTSVERYRQSGLADLAGELKMVISDQWPVDELNHILQTTGYLGVYLKKNKETPFTVSPLGQELVCFSGGARGSDYAWEKKGVQVGWHVQVLSFDRHYIEKSGGGNVVRIPQMYLDMADKWMSQVAQDIHRTFPMKTQGGTNLLRRNYWQVKETEQTVAVGNLCKNKKTVSGGTGWAVQLSILWEIPTYVFDLNSNQWYLFDQWLGVFEETNPPILARKFSGIGTRDLTKEGVLAIIDCYDRTIALKERSMDSRSLQTLFDKWHISSQYSSNPTEIVSYGQELVDLGEDAGEFLIQKLKSGYHTVVFLLAKIYPEAVTPQQEQMGHMRHLWLSWWEKKTGKTISKVRVIQTADQIARVETGALQINDDWPGLFIRGDNCMGLALNIQSLFHALENIEINGLNARLALSELRSIQQTIFEDVRCRPPGEYK